MPEISFEDLYDTDKEKSLAVFLIWVNDFIQGYGEGQIKTAIDPNRTKAFVDSLRKENFPACGGYEEASPFKKAAYIYVLLHEEATNPFILDPLPAQFIPDSIRHIPSSTSSIIGLALVQSCLEGASFTNKFGTLVTLNNRIDSSRHYFRDMIEASRGITTTGHFRLISLLIESWAYQANPEAGYRKKFNQDISNIPRLPWQ